MFIWNICNFSSDLPLFLYNHSYIYTYVHHYLDIAVTKFLSDRQKDNKNISCNKKKKLKYVCLLGHCLRQFILFFAA